MLAHTGNKKRSDLDLLQRLDNTVHRAQRHLNLDSPFSPALRGDLNDLSNELFTTDVPLSWALRHEWVDSMSELLARDHYARTDDGCCDEEKAA